MITREEIRRLAQIDSPAGCAISFYFQPQVPHDKSHREEAILVKDLVREALRKAERQGNHQVLRDDLKKILEIAEHLHGNHSRGKAIFACSEQGLWRELDVPPRLGQSLLTVNSRFHLKPLVAANSGCPRTCVALVNREKARLFELYEDGIKQLPDLYFGELPHIGRSDGFGGYDAGHRQRYLENEVKQHFKQFADALQLLLNRDRFEALLIGCHDEAWPDLEQHLHPYVQRRLMGRFLVDPVAASLEQVREQAGGILAEFAVSQQQGMIREVIGEARRNARGALGLRHVLTALERQEVQMLVVSHDFTAEAVVCVNCRRLDTRMVHNCALCGQETRELSDVSDALVDLALRNGAEIMFVGGAHDLKPGGIGALLRYRADQNTAQKIAV